MSPEQTAPPGGSPPSGGSSGGGEAAGGLGGIGLIALLLLALGIGIPALVASPDDEEAQVQPASTDESVHESLRVVSRGAIAK